MRVPILHFNADTHAASADARRAAKDKLLHFIDNTNCYETDRLFGLLPADGMLFVALSLRQCP